MSSQPHSGVDKKEFTRACGRFATGITVASVRDASGTPHGLTVNSFTSVSLEPPLVLVCLGHEASVLEYFRAASHFGISILAEDQRALSDHFARKGHDRFDGVAWHAGPHGAPILDGVVASLECRVERRLAAGDHDIFLGEVVSTSVHEDSRPLIYFASRYRHLG
jgi:flavin reductase (DIM6/NTAB) family NADH-FMN oxidoreductase RutF